MEIEIIPSDFGHNNINNLWYDIKDGNDKLGFISILFSNDGKDIYLSEIYINSGDRNIGVGTKAVQKLIDFGKIFGMSTIWLMVDFNNEIAQHVYRKLGFVFLNHISDYCYKMEYRYERN